MPPSPSQELADNFYLRTPKKVNDPAPNAPVNSGDSTAKSMLQAAGQKIAQVVKAGSDKLSDYVDSRKNPQVPQKQGSNEQNSGKKGIINWGNIHNQDRFKKKTSSKGKGHDPMEKLIASTPTLDNSSAYNASGTKFFTRDGKVIPMA